MHYRVKIWIVKEKISDVLKEVFAGSGISYVIMGDDIILEIWKRKAASTQQKKVEIVGGVVDARSGESVVGATVRVKGREQRSDYRYGRKVYGLRPLPEMCLSFHISDMKPRK